MPRASVCAWWSGCRVGQGARIAPRPRSQPIQRARFPRTKPPPRPSGKQYPCSEPGHTGGVGSAPSRNSHPRSGMRPALRGLGWDRGRRLQPWGSQTFPGGHGSRPGPRDASCSAYCKLVKTYKSVTSPTSWLHKSCYILFVPIASHPRNAPTNGNVRGHARGKDSRGVL